MIDVSLETISLLFPNICNFGPLISGRFLTLYPLLYFMTEVLFQLLSVFQEALQPQGLKQGL